MTEAQRKHFFEIRRVLDNMIAAIPAADESQFNASAAVINDNAAAIRAWNANADYSRGNICVDPADGVPYWAMHNNGVTSGQVYQPSLSPTVWTHCHGTSAATARPFLAEGHNPYMAGHFCLEGGIVARCILDNTVFAPSIYPSAWEVVQ